MPSLAHEGNPKEDEISISGGSVLSTAQLDIDFQFFGGGVPNVPNVEDPSSLSRVQSCPDVFSWIPYNNAMFWTDQCLSSGGDIFRSFDTQSIITIHQTPTCYGILSQTFPGVAAPQSMSFASTLLSLDSGLPVCGVVLAASIPNSVEVVSCLAVISDWNAGITYLVLFTGDDIKNVTNGSILYSASYTPSIGDYYFIASIQEPGETTVTGKIYSANGYPTSQVWGADITQVMTNLNRAGYIALGHQTSGQASFGRSVNGSCSNDSITMFAYSDTTV